MGFVRKIIILLFFIVFLAGLGFHFRDDLNNVFLKGFSGEFIDEGEADPSPHPLSIETLRQGDYPGSEITIEQELTPESGYQRYIASYKSEGLKIYALLTIPSGQVPSAGWPVIIFNHGFIQPDQYKTTEKYVAYVDGFARNGYVIFKPDFRGHGNSEGQPTGAYGSNGYTIDVLNALSSIKKYPSVNPDKIGMWGHSMGGFITLRAMVVDPDIKAGVIWGGVVGSYEGLFYNWRRRNSPPPGTFPTRGGNWRQTLTAQYGEPKDNQDFWRSLSANSYLASISGPIQLDHGEADQSVPVDFSKKLAEELNSAGKVVELYTYEGNDHNISQSFSLAMSRSIAFFDKYLK